MFSNKISIIYFIVILISVVTQIQTLVELPIVEDNDIAIVEKAIRNSVNDLFTALRIAKVNHNRRLKQHLTIHNFFVSITLQDCDNLKEIARLTRVNNIDNDTQHFIAQINEVLNEDDKSNEVDTNNVYVTRYINTFIRKLRYLKDNYANDKTVLNEDVLNYLHHNEFALINDSRYNNIDKSYDNNKITFKDIEYWYPSNRRIYNGIRTNIKTFPFMASIHFFKKFQCAGSIIKHDLVITSASCLQLAWTNRYFRENPAFLSVQVGSDMYENGGEKIEVLEVSFHPSYDPKLLRNNLAIMALTRKITSRKHLSVKKIDFDRSPTPMPVNANRIIVIGWGAKDQTNIISHVFNNIISYAELDYYPLMECQKHYSEEYVTFQNFCAGFFSEGSGACNRDAGGPAILDGKLIGVISFGSPSCGALDKPTVFTKLGYYADWIESVIEQKTLHHGKKTTTTQAPPKFDFPPKASVDQRKGTFSTITKLNTTNGQNLRIPEDAGFKHFLATMFSDNEIEEQIKFGRNKSVKDISDVENEKKSKSAKQNNENDESKSSKVNVIPAADKLLEISVESDKASLEDSGRTKTIIKQKTTKHKTTKQKTTIEYVKPVTRLNVGHNNDDKSNLNLQNDILNLFDSLILNKIIENDVANKKENKNNKQLNSSISISKEKISNINSKLLDYDEKEEDRQDVDKQEEDIDARETGIQTNYDGDLSNHKDDDRSLSNQTDDDDDLSNQTYNDRSLSNQTDDDGDLSSHTDDDAGLSIHKDDDESLSKNKDYDAGLSKQSDTFVDFTFREKAKTNMSLSLTSIAELILKAINEERQKLYKFSS